MSVSATAVRFFLIVLCGIAAGSRAAHAECRFSEEGDLVVDGEKPAAVCSPLEVLDSGKGDAKANRPDLWTPLNTGLPARLKLVFTNQAGEEVVDPAKARDKGVYTVRAYRTTADAEEVKARIEAAKASIEPTKKDLRRLQQCWGEWGQTFGFTCDAASLRGLHTQLLLQQRLDCPARIGVEAKAKCAWYSQAVALTAQALKPAGTGAELALDSACAALAAQMQSPGTKTCGALEDVAKIRTIDSLLKTLQIPAGNRYDILVSKTEFIWNDEEFFRTVDFEQSATLVSPSESWNSYVAITNFPHDLDAIVEWKADHEDPSDSLKNASGFVGFLIASYAHQAASFPPVLPMSATGGVTMASPEGAVLLPPTRTSPDDVQRLLDLLPPERPTGTRFIGPIRPSKDTRYRLSITERIPEGKPRSTITASQTIEYLPRYHWFVTLNAGVSVDGFVNEKSGASADNPIYEHRWIAAESGPTSTSFARESSALWERRITPFLGLLISPPWGFLNRDRGRWVLQVSVGVPLNQHRGVAQFGAGVGFWFRAGISLTLSGILRVYDQPISPIGAAQLVLPNNGAVATPPILGVRDAVAGGFSLGLGIDLGKAGGAFLDAVKPLFSSKEGK